MQKIKVTRLFSKFTAKDNPFRAIIPFLLATLLFTVTITPLYAQLTEESTPSVYENSTNLTTTETTVGSSIKPEAPQPTAAFCPTAETLVNGTKPPKNSHHQKATCLVLQLSLVNMFFPVHLAKSGYATEGYCKYNYVDYCSIGKR